MKHSIRNAGLLALVVCMSGCATVLGARDTVVIRAKEKVASALVHIRPVKEVFMRGKKEEMLIMGSGFLITSDGYVVTNEHVAGKSKFVTCVLYNKDEVKAEVVGVDPYTDIAVLKLKTDRKDLPHVRMGDSEKLKAGQTVLALGSPHGLARSVSRGIVSVTDRYLGEQDDAVSPYNNWIQTDAAINFGNSGGPLVNLKGEVVGVNARMLKNAENVGFAIPINIAKDVVAQIIKDGRVKRSWIGITLQEMTAKTEDAKQAGAVIADIDPISPAASAGVKPGDILLAVDGTPTNARFAEDLPAVSKLIADIPVGKEIVLRISRDAKEEEIHLKTVEKNELKGEEVEIIGWGFTVADPTPEVIRFAQLPSKQGVLVTGAQVGGIAGNAGLNQGDIILTIDNQPVLNLEGFKQQYEKVFNAKQHLVLLTVKHGALSRFVMVKQEPSASAQAAGNAQ